MLNAFVAATKVVANEFQAKIAEQNPEIARTLDLPQRQRFLELIARGFNTFVHGLARATRSEESGSSAAASSQSPQALNICLGPQVPQAPGPQAPRNEMTDEEQRAAKEADDDAFAQKFAQVFLDMGGIFPKLAQVLSLRPDLIRNSRVLKKLRAVQEDCQRQPFDKVCALAAAESSDFREGRRQLRDWPEYIYAGSVAQVAPFVNRISIDEAALPEDVARQPDGVLKLAFTAMKEVMEVDFRLLRSQVHWMEQTGRWTQGEGLPSIGGMNLSQENIKLIKEVWNVMLGMEAEILQEFDLRHEAECQLRGALLAESLLEVAPGGECEWLEQWRDSALVGCLQPAGPVVVGKAQAVWRDSGAGGSVSPGLLGRVGLWCVGGQALASEAAEAQAHLVRLRTALRCLRVEVPEVFCKSSGEHVLAMGYARGRSLKQVLDLAMEEQPGAGPTDSAKKAASWFAAVLLFVILPLWGKMLLVVGCCHADPHPGNFKVDGIPGLEFVAAQTPEPQRRLGLLRRLTFRSPVHEPEESRFTLSVLDWGSCIDLDEPIRAALCRLIVGLSDLRRAQRHLLHSSGPDLSAVTEADATIAVADSIRSLGIQGSDDNFLAALGMALFDPAVARNHPLLRNGAGREELERSFPNGSVLGKVLRIVAILVGMCRELELRLNTEASDRLPSGDGQNREFVDLFVVELWRPFAEEGLA